MKTKQELINSAWREIRDGYDDKVVWLPDALDLIERKDKEIELLKKKLKK